MRWLIETSLRLRVVVLALAVLLVIVGAQSWRTTPIDVFPEFAPPLVEVQTEAPGLSTEEVESLVTLPLESRLNGSSWLETIRSKSVLGLSSIVLIFEEGTDFLRARQIVQERVSTAAAELPAVVKPPVILPPLSSTSRVLKVGVSSRRLSQMELTDLARWIIRPRLMAIPGVANVAIWGQRDRQFQVLVDPDRLLAHGVSLDAVVAAAGEAAALGGGGFIDTPTQRLAVRQLAPIVTPEDLEQSVVDVRDGAPIRIGDVAAVETGFPTPIGDAVINDGPGLLLIVEKQPWGNTLDVTRDVEAALAALTPGLDGVEIDPSIFRPATFIERALYNLTRALVVGSALVVIILATFLADWRTALISLTAIPLSLLGAGIVLHWWGGTIDTMVLAGLVLAIGEVVDDAIIDVENIARRLRLNRASEHPRAPLLVVLEASTEVRSAIVFASLILVLVFLPVFFLEGVAGAFFRPLAWAYVLAILASLLVALTVTPALSFLLLPRTRAPRAEPRVVAVLKARYRALLPAVLARPAWAVGLVLGGFALATVAIPGLGQEFLPDFQETDFLMHWVEKPGTSLEAAQRVSARVSRELRAIPGVRNFGAHLGRAEVADEVVGPNFGELWISVDDTTDYASTVARIREVVAGYPGLYRDVLTYLKERIKEVLTGAGATIVVRIYGADLDVLREKAVEVREAIAGIEGVADLKIEPQVLVPQIDVRLDPEALARFGLTPRRVQQSAATLVQGTVVGQVYEDQKIIDVAVRGIESVRASPEALRELRIDLPAGGQVPLRDVAHIAVVPAPNEIKREGASRRIDVLCNVHGRDLGTVARRVEHAVRALPFPRGYHPEFLGEYAARERSQRRLLAFSGLSVLGILLILHSDFRSVRLTLLVFLTLPFALIGGVAAAVLGGGVLSLGSLVGFVAVLGIAARNGIMLVSHYRHLEQEEGEPFGAALVLRGAEERLAPILMTALTAALALLPLVLGGSRPGYEIEHPMATVILGGIVTSTLLNLFVLPALYATFGQARPPG
jgi:CzcA family heavy metal efflux pump